jgi:rare lipoprotein A (peptidoglycan hydrolase)
VALGFAACAPSPRTADVRIATDLHTADEHRDDDAVRDSAPDAVRSTPRRPTPARVLVGRASWYGAFHHGRLTANGERFDMYALTAAHRTLRLGSHVRVTNLVNGRSVDVRITDRGPMIPGRIIDLSRAAAVALDGVDAGVFPVRVTLLD